MDISIRFNRFYHSILNDLFKKSNRLQIRGLIDTRTGGAFMLEKHEHYSDMDDLKQLLKILNVNYKVNEDKDEKTSTKDIDNKALLEHIEWIFYIASVNSIALDVVEAEWNYLINYYK